MKYHMMTERDPDVIRGLHREMAKHYEISDILRVPDIDVDDSEAFISYCLNRAALVAFYHVSRGFAGWVILSDYDVQNSSARFHFAQKPWVSLSTIIKLFPIFCSNFSQIRCLQAYIPIERVSVIRLAVQLGFAEVHVSDEVWYGFYFIEHTEHTDDTDSSGAGSSPGHPRGRRSAGGSDA